MPRRHRYDLLDQFLDHFSLRALLLHQATLFAAATLAILLGVVFLWENHQSVIVNPAEYKLTADKIRLNPQPGWAEVDLRQLILDTPGDESPSILDPQLVGEAAGRIQTVGFVERVNRIVKSKSGLDVELSYRQPVAAVELNATTIQEWPAGAGTILLPVDRNGVLMPRELTEQGNWIRLSMLYPARSTELTTWSDWPDLRVRHAAAVAAELVNRHDHYGVARVVTFAEPPTETGESVEEPFELWSPLGKNGTIVVWGSAPGQEQPREASPAQKLAALGEFIQQFGPLEQAGARRIDLRWGQPQELPESKVASQPRRRLESL